jgi:hypothetical protein
MRLIILGQARHDQYFSNLIQKAYSCAIHNLNQHNISRDRDCLCFLQYETNDERGVDARITPETIELVISQAQPPTLTTLSKAMRQAILQFTTK